MHGGVATNNYLTGRDEGPGHSAPPLVTPAVRASAVDPRGAATDPRQVRSQEPIKRHTMAILQHLPEFVKESSSAMKWARTIAVILSIEHEVGTCFGSAAAAAGDGSAQDKKLKQQRAAKAVMDRWFAGRETYDHCALEGAVRLESERPHAVDTDRPTIARRLLNSYADLRKTFFFGELLAGQHGTASQRAAAAVVKAVRGDGSAKQDSRQNFLENAARVERYFWKSQEAVQVHKQSAPSIDFEGFSLKWYLRLQVSSLKIMMISFLKYDDCLLKMMDLYRNRWIAILKNDEMAALRCGCYLLRSWRGGELVRNSPGHRNALLK